MSRRDAGADVPTECLRYETLIASAGGAEIAGYRMRAASAPRPVVHHHLHLRHHGEPKGVMLTHIICPPT